MRVFRITYDGVSVGGEAFVVAEDERQALEILKAAPRSFGAENAEVSEVDMSVAQLLYNDAGDL